MADYKAIKGHNIQTVAGDPDPLQVGDIWYSSTTKKIRGAKLAAGAWATGNNVNTGRGLMGLTGIQTAAILVGGGTPPGAVHGETEAYDGSTWTEVADLNTDVVNNVAFGTSTAAVNTGGNTGTAVTDNSETWDGSSWTTSPADMTTARSKLSAANQGTTTAGLIFAGSSTFPNNNVAITEEWDGSSWTEVADLSTVRRGAAGAGTSTAALCISGYTGPGATYKEEVESWNGTSWTEVADVNSVRQHSGSSGTTTSALVYGGQPGTLAITEEWDGTSWTEVADLATAREGLGRGTGVSALSALAVGADHPNNNLTEEWDQSPAASSFTSS